MMMMVVRLHVLLILIMSTCCVCDTERVNMTILEALELDVNYTNLYTMLSDPAYSEVATLLNSTTNISSTLFAVPNEGFPTNESLWPSQDVMKYHIVTSAVAWEALVSKPSTFLNSWLTDPTYVQLNGNGQVLHVVNNNISVSITDGENSYLVGGTYPTIECSNGYIHALQSTMKIPPSLLEFVNGTFTNGVNKWYAAIARSGLLETVTNMQQVALFVSQSQSFQLNSMDLMKDADVQIVLSYMIVPGTNGHAYYSKWCNGTVTTLTNQEAEAKYVNGMLTYSQTDDPSTGESTFALYTDIIISNGVIHITDGLIATPFDSQVTIIENIGRVPRLTHFVSYVDNDTDVKLALSTPHATYTGMFPTNAAMEVALMSWMSNVTAEDLSHILRYHVGDIQGPLMIIERFEVTTILREDDFAAAMVVMGDILVPQGNATWGVPHVANQSANIELGFGNEGQVSSNGNTYLLDGVLQPPHHLDRFLPGEKAEVLAIDAGITQFMHFLQQPACSDVWRRALNSSGITVFAPTDAAIIYANLSGQSVQAQRLLCMNHLSLDPQGVFVQWTMPAVDVINVRGGHMNVSTSLIDPGATTLEYGGQNYNVTIVNIPLRNGWLHVIDGVIGYHHVSPTNPPTASPTDVPTPAPTRLPTNMPTQSPTPSPTPSASPKSGLTPGQTAAIVICVLVAVFALFAFLYWYFKIHRFEDYAIHRDHDDRRRSSELSSLRTSSGYGATSQVDDDDN